ncbi:MAG: hypothetical protein K8R52_11065 [Bacteroidales bacterium]|nr:hypothetical protein [Bacteroidales bacterium]
MAGLRENIGRRVLKKKTRSFQRETRVHNFKTAESAVILFDAEMPNAFQIIKEFRGFLKEEGIRCTVFGYINQKEIPQEMLFWKDFHVITKSDLSWYMQPGGETVELYKRENPDILMDFTVNQRLEIQFLVQLSPARFKIGCYTEEKNDYDLMINLSEQDDMAYLSEQIRHYVSILNPVK